jgi:hypothetical protein
MNAYFQKVFIDGQLEYMTEKQLVENGPMLVDIDLQYDPSITTRQHNDDYIIDLIAVYLDKINYYLEVPHGTNMNIFVLEKANIWDDLPIKNTWDQVVDEGVAKGHVNWQLYGSRKPGHEAYLISNHYTSTYTNEWSMPLQETEQFDTSRFIKHLSARFTGNPKTCVKEETRKDFDEAVLNLARRGRRKLTLVKSDNDVKLILQSGRFDKINDEATLDKIIDYMLEQTGPADYKIRETHEYALALPKEYYGKGSYCKWIRVGWALANTSPKMFVTWLKLSCQENCRSSLAKGDKFDWNSSVSIMYELWKGFDCSGTTDGLSHRSIMYWCKRDSINKYEIIHKNTIDYFIDQTTIDATEFDLAMVLFNIFKDRFVCISIRNKCWYEYINHRWFEIDSGSTLRLCISKDMHREYLTRIHDMTTQMQTMEQNDSKYEPMRKKTYKLAEIAVSLKKTHQKNNIMREACELFYDKEFFNKLDQNPYLLCFSNGVIDFKAKKHRAGQPDDYISKCTNIDYIPLKSIHDPIISRIKTFMDQLFPNKQLRGYMWEHLASVLIGTLDNQTFNIYTGSGRNGKSCLVDLMGKVLGAYKGTVPSTLITLK